MIRLLMVVVTTLLGVIALILAVLALLTAGWVAACIVVLVVTGLVLAVAKGVRFLRDHGVSLRYRRASEPGGRIEHSDPGRTICSRTRPMT